MLASIIMIHPSNLLRSNSERAQFSAPVGNYLNEIDCGIKALPCLSDRLNLQKLAKLSVFVVVLCLMGCAHGIINSYFTGTSQLWTSHYSFPGSTKGWLVVSNEIFVGILALCVSYWGNRIHRTTWMGALTMLIAVSGATLAIPEIHRPFTGVEITSAIIGPPLCTNFTVEESSRVSVSNETVTSDYFDEIILLYIIIFQVVFGSVIISFISHGLTYIDDHTSTKQSPVLIGLVLASHVIGKQGGIYFAWMPYMLHINGIFVSPIWIIIIILTFLIGAGMALFPKVLPNMVLRKSVNSLVSIAAGGDPMQEEEIVDGYFQTLWRLLKNKILLLNIASYVVVQSAIINFALFEKYFNQSKYHVSIEDKDSSGYSDPSIIQMTTNLLKQPLIAVSFLTTGLIIAKIKPKPRNLVIWNTIAFALVILIFCSTAFFNCTHGIKNEHKHSITIPFCSTNCACPTGEPFQPVCVDGSTYFSPCVAGCKNFTAATNVYHDCSCGSIVTEGSCDEDRCKFILALSQVNNIVSNAIMASTLIVNVLIILRSVAKQDKATALGLELTFLGLVPYIPVKIIYHFVTEGFCEIQNDNGCQYFSENFPLAVSIVTISLEFCGVLLSLLLLMTINNINLFKNRISYDYELNNFHSRINTIDRNDSQNPEDNLPPNEQDPFIQELTNSLQRRHTPQMSRQERMQSYIDDGELVPPLQPPPKRRSSKMSSKSESGKSDSSNSTTNRANSLDMLNGKSELASNKIGSKASASIDSDMSSLDRFADSLEFLDNSSQDSKRFLEQTIAEIDEPQENKAVPQQNDVFETAF
ncbi:solute carrier organic anion transporter family member 2B1-like isoform X1 [Diabrotica undecimpunctata]|uniref:solute carrier organic anion transporter family member 2B1-like isoform X1 n=1 Tax=Diabrotica undecimpunctata TaxID=50387 RepID=UPI003B63E297